MTGEMIEANIVILRRNVGFAEAGDGQGYELGLCANSAPLIRSEKTGRYWTLSWNELVALARANGIDEQGAPAPEGGPDAA